MRDTKKLFDKHFEFRSRLNDFNEFKHIIEPTIKPLSFAERQRSN